MLPQIRQIIMGVTILAAAGCSASAQSSYESNCGRKNGVYACESTYQSESGYRSATTSTYSGGQYRSETTTSRPDTFHNETMIYDSRAEARKAAALRKSGYHAPGEVVLPCSPPWHMTARDGCQ